MHHAHRITDITQSGRSAVGVVPGVEPVQRVLELCALDGVRYVDP